MKKLTKLQKLLKKENIAFLSEKIIEDNIIEYIEESISSISKIETIFRYADKLITEIVETGNYDIELDEYDFESILSLVSELYKLKKIN